MNSDAGTRNGKRFIIIANPEAGRGRARAILKDVVRCLKSAGARFDVSVTAGPGDAEKMSSIASRESDVAAIVSVGGDGTLNEIVQQAVFSGTPLAVVPAGSGNDFSKVLNLPRSIDGIVDAILAGRAKVIDAGKMNSRYFINSAGIGFDAAVNYHTRGIRWFKAGLPVYFASFLKTLGKYRPLPMRITMDGRAIAQDMFLVSIGNGTTCGGGFRLTPHARIDDGLFDVTLVRPLSTGQILWHLPKVFLGTIDRTRHAETMRTTMLRVESDHPLPVQVDGEVFAMEGGSCEFSIVPKSLTVIGNFPEGQG